VKPVGGVRRADAEAHEDARRLALMHEREHLTDVNVRRLRAAAGAAHVTIAWDYPGSTLLEVRILRSEAGFAESADEAAAAAQAGDEAADGGRAPAQQALVYSAASGSFRDTDVRRGATYFYTVFARMAARVGDDAAEAGGRAGAAASRPPWTCWGGVEARPGAAGAARITRVAST
jgi:hypothetical protein